MVEERKARVLQCGLKEAKWLTFKVKLWHKRITVSLEGEKEKHFFS